MTEELIPFPSTGELLDLRSAPTDQIAGELLGLVEFERDARAFRRAASDELARRLDHEGRRSADVGDFHVEVNAPAEKKWKPGALELTLARLVEQGDLSMDKARRCIRWEPKVIWGEVKTLLSDPRIKDDIAACFTEEPTTRTARVRGV
jgi:hypothetical protein